MGGKDVHSFSVFLVSAVLAIKFGPKSIVGEFYVCLNGLCTHGALPPSLSRTHTFQTSFFFIFLFAFSKGVDFSF